MLKGVAGFVAGAIIGLLLAMLLMRAVKPPQWAKDDFTGIMAILYALMVLSGIVLTMLLFAILGTLAAVHYL